MSGRPKLKVGILVATGVLLTLSGFMLGRFAFRGSETAGPGTLKLLLRLESREHVTAAATGEFGWAHVFVVGTVLPMERGRVRVFRRVSSSYEVAWTSTDLSGGVESIILEDVTMDRRTDLIALSRAGSGAYLDARIFFWEAGTIKEVWSLGADPSQLLSAARLSIRRASAKGDLELIVRAPTALNREGGKWFGPWPHQVSIYRWSPRDRRFVLFNRFVDRREMFD